MVRFGDRLMSTACQQCFPNHLPSGSPNATHIQWLKPNAECSNTNTQGLNLRKHVERTTCSRKSRNKIQEVVFLGGKAKRKMNKHSLPIFGLFSTKAWLLDKKEEKQTKTVGVVELELVQHLEASEGRVWSVVFRPGRFYICYRLTKSLPLMGHGKVIKNKITKTWHFSLKL